MMFFSILLFLGFLFQNIDKRLSKDTILKPHTLRRHSGRFLAGIHHDQRPKDWIPAKSLPE
jgi:hypothetical protein